MPGGGELFSQQRAGAVQGKIPVNTEERRYACDAAPEPQLIGSYSAVAREIVVSPMGDRLEWRNAQAGSSSRLAM